MISKIGSHHETENKLSWTHFHTHEHQYTDQRHIAASCLVSGNILAQRSDSVAAMPVNL